MVGLVEDLSHITTSFFKDEGDLIYVIGKDFEEIGGSEYLKVTHNQVAGDSPKLELANEKKLHDAVLSLIRKRLIKSAHDVSEGGIACALAECCIINEEKLIGASVQIPIKTRADFSFFSESQSRIIVSVNPNLKNEFENEIKNSAQPYFLIGTTESSEFNINGKIVLDLREA
jgi:phosphoribosylformylglycinamidine synthase